MLLPNSVSNDRKNVFPPGQIEQAQLLLKSKRINIWETLETTVQTDLSKIRFSIH